MRRATEKFCAWGGVVFGVLLFVGFMVVARFIPPPSPSDSAAAIAAIYREHTQSIRTGVLFGFIGMFFFTTFFSGIVGQTRRIRGAAPALKYVQIASVGAATVLVIMPMPVWWTAAYRPEELSDQLIMVLNDYAFIVFIIGYVALVTFFVATGLVILSDEHHQPLYPRWSGYLSLFLGIMQVSASPLVYVKTGPFAWDGLIAFWLPVVEFFSWIVVFTVLTLKAIDSSYGDAGSVNSGESPAVPT